MTVRRKIKGPEFRAGKSLALRSPAGGWLASWLAVALGTSAFCAQATAAGVRIKDVAEVKGVRDNDLSGVGLVVGLAATGDSAASASTRQALAVFLSKQGHGIKPEQVVPGSAALVSVTAKMQTFMQNGDQFDIRIAALGDASSLAGGTLLMTPLRAADGKVYATASGRVATSSDASPKNALTAGAIIGGGTIESEFRPEIERYGQVILSLRDPDFTTALNVADVVNGHLNGFHAKAADPSRIEIIVPEGYRDRLVDLIAEIEQLTVAPDAKAVVVINERSGTVVSGAQVIIEPVAISHGNLTIEVGQSTMEVSDPARKMPPQQVTVGSLAQGVVGFGLKPRDLIDILQALRASGALRAELKFL